MILARKQNEIKTKVSEGFFELPNQSIPGATDVVIETTLDHAGYKQGHLVLYIPNAAPMSSIDRRKAFFLSFTTDKQNAMSHAAVEATVSCGCGCYSTYRDTHGFYFDRDNKLSDYKIGTNGQIFIKECQIIGNKLTVTFRNNHGSIAGNAWVEGRYYVYR